MGSRREEVPAQLWGVRGLGTLLAKPSKVKVVDEVDKSLPTVSTPDTGAWMDGRISRVFSFDAITY